MAVKKAKDNPRAVRVHEAGIALFLHMPEELEQEGHELVSHSIIDKGHEYLYSVKARREDGKVEIAHATGLDPETAVLSFIGRLRQVGIAWRESKWG